jgi:hypothetical protein
MCVNYGQTSQEIYPPIRGYGAWGTTQWIPLGLVESSE